LNNLPNYYTLKRSVKGIGIYFFYRLITKKIITYLIYEKCKLDINLFTIIEIN